jgi:hypothetical protein
MEPGDHQLCREMRRFEVRPRPVFPVGVSSAEQRAPRAKNCRQAAAPPWVLPLATPLPDEIISSYASAGGFVIRCPARELLCRLFLGSSAVEHSTVNRMVAGSNPARGASSAFTTFPLPLSKPPLEIAHVERFAAKVLVRSALHSRRRPASRSRSSTATVGAWPARTCTGSGFHPALATRPLCCTRWMIPSIGRGRKPNIFP